MVTVRTPGAAIIPDETFAEKVRSAVFVQDEDAVVAGGAAARARVMEHRSLSEVQAELRAETDKRARKAGRQM